jgi:hypothetical protein
MIEPGGITAVAAAPATIATCLEICDAPVVSAEVVPSLLVVWRVFKRIGTVNVLDII